MAATVTAEIDRRLGRGSWCLRAISRGWNSGKSTGSRCRRGVRKSSSAGDSSLVCQTDFVSAADRSFGGNDGFSGASEGFSAVNSLRGLSSMRLDDASAANSSRESSALLVARGGTPEVLSDIQFQ
jgi:hypothetical protein